MAWRIVKQPNGLYAKFSEVVDNVTDYNMTAHEAFVLCIEEHCMTVAAANKKIESADASASRFDECLEIIKDIHGEDERAQVVAMCGASNQCNA